MKWPRLLSHRTDSPAQPVSDGVPPPQWNEPQYLSSNPDVARAVEAGGFTSGWVHYQRHGQYEGRPGVSLPAGYEIQASGWDPAWTRDCADPWVYAELTPDLGVRPCCNHAALASWDTGRGSIAAARDSEGFRTLRDRLRTGKLSPTCAACHMKPVVPVATMQRQFASNDALPLGELRVDLTSRCNLRCVYCAVSQPDYRGADMSVDTFEAIVALAESRGPGFTVWLNGHGETTFHDRWTELAERLLAVGSALHMTTNLARAFDPHELDCLSRFRMIQVSLDTVDTELLCNTRRKMRLSTVLRNLDEIRARTDRPGVVTPLLTLGCVVHDRNYTGLPELARFAVAQRFSGVTFWQLVKYPDLPGVENVYPVPDLDPDQFAHAVDRLGCAEKILRDRGVAVLVAGGFDRAWRRQIETRKTGD